MSGSGSNVETNLDISSVLESLKMIEEFSGKLGTKSKLAIAQLTNLLLECKSNGEFTKENQRKLINYIDAILSTKIDKVGKELLVNVKNILTLYIASPHFRPPNEVITQDAMVWEYFPEGKERLGFRGDDRKPSEIFENGFTPRKQPSTKKRLLKPFDSNMKYVVAFSTRFASALLFPYDEEVERMYIYIFKSRKFFDVHRHGYESQLNKTQDQDSVFGLFLDELITDKVEPQDIIGAVPITRYAYDKFIDVLPEYLKSPATESVDKQKLTTLLLARGIYLVGDYEPNPNCTLDEEEKIRVKNFIELEKEVNKSANRKIPKAEIKIYLEKNKTFLHEQGVHDKDINLYLKDQLKNGIAKRKIAKFIEAYKFTVLSAQRLPDPNSGYKHRLFTKSTKQNKEENKAKKIKTRLRLK